METDPRKLFMRLFGQGDNAAERARLSAQYTSLLDMVGDETKELQSVVGPSDKAMLSDYLESVREIERRIQKMEARDLSHVPIPNAPAAAALPFDEHINLMFDLVALAYQANMTRVFSFMVAAEVSGQTYNFIGVPDAFHPLSHHNNEQGQDGSPGEGADLSHAGIREVPGQARQNAGWRRHHAGPFAVPLRQQHEQQ